jgi:cell division protein FtsB
MENKWEHRFKKVEDDNQQLKADNQQLKADNQKLKSKMDQIEDKLETLTQAIAERERSTSNMIQALLKPS